MIEEPATTQPAGDAGSQPQPGSSLPIPIIAGGLFGLLVLAAVFWIARRPPTTPPPPPSEESLGYLPQVTVSDFHLSAADNMVGSVIVYLDGKVTNGGDRTVRGLRVRLHFYDTMSQVILREERDIVTADGTPLRAGETRDFQLRFNRPPAPWNVQPPTFQLVSLEIE
ncbi:MAG: hypothetical protein HY316_09505 [Acidobacteria bacterium]|nr:hypothetical protein [Acidobacteriota bacterium]